MRNYQLRDLILAALFAALAAVSARISFTVPAISTVPFTLQVLVVLLSGALLGPAWGAASMVVYLLLGLAGAPVFAGGAAGLSVLLGLTGGYLFAYPVAAAVVGLIAPPHRRPGALLVGLAMVAGIVVIYAGGAGWAVFAAGKSAAVAWAHFVAPYILFDLAKAGVAGSIALAVTRALAAQGYWSRRAA